MPDRFKVNVKVEFESYANNPTLRIKCIHCHGVGQHDPRGCYHCAGKGYIELTTPKAAAFAAYWQALEQTNELERNLRESEKKTQNKIRENALAKLTEEERRVLGL